MKRTKTILNKSLDGNIVQHTLEFNVKGPKVYKAGVIEEYIKERNNWYLQNGPEYLKQIIRDENRY